LLFLHDRKGANGKLGLELQVNRKQHREDGHREGGESVNGEANQLGFAERGESLPGLDGQEGAKEEQDPVVGHQDGNHGVIHRGVASHETGRLGSGVEGSRGARAKPASHDDHLNHHNNATEAEQHGVGGRDCPHLAVGENAINTEGFCQQITTLRKRLSSVL